MTDSLNKQLGEVLNFLIQPSWVSPSELFYTMGILVGQCDQVVWEPVESIKSENCDCPTTSLQLAINCSFPTWFYFFPLFFSLVGLRKYANPSNLINPRSALIIPLITKSLKEGKTTTLEFQTARWEDLPTMKGLSSPLYKHLKFKRLFISMTGWKWPCPCKNRGTGPECGIAPTMTTAKFSGAKKQVSSRSCLLEEFNGGSFGSSIALQVECINVVFKTRFIESTGS
jgi:hypothetical protein